MAELTWKTHPITPPEEIEKLIADLKAGQVDERHLEWEIDFLMSEAVGLFRSEIVLSDLLYHPDAGISAELRTKREPFLRVSLELTKAERNKRLDQLLMLISKLRASNP